MGNLSHYVEKQQREHDSKRLNSELKNVTENLTKSIENLSKVEKSLNDAINRGITSDRRLQVFLEQQQKFRSEIKTLTESKNEIETELKNLVEDLEEGEIKDENESNQSDNETKTETKQEKSIRLGQMTAFGKVLTSKSNHDEDFIAKRKCEKDWMNSGEDSDDNIQKKRKRKKTAEVKKSGAKVRPKKLDKVEG